MAEEYLLRSQLCEGSLLCRSFWYGKYLQALPPSSEPGGGASQQELLLTGLQSSLSVGVHQLLLGDTHTSPLPGLLRVDGTLELAVIGSHLQEGRLRCVMGGLHIPWQTSAVQTCPQWQPSVPVCQSRLAGSWREGEGHSTGSTTTSGPALLRLVNPAAAAALHCCGCY